MIRSSSTTHVASVFCCFLIHNFAQVRNDYTLTTIAANVSVNQHVRNGALPPDHYSGDSAYRGRSTIKESFYETQKYTPSAA